MENAYSFSELAKRTGIPACNFGPAGLSGTVNVSGEPDPSRCIKCGRSLDPDDIGAHKKFINRGASMFFCIACLAQYIDVSEPFLRDKIEYFRRSGCTLFGSKTR